MTLHEYTLDRARQAAKRVTSRDISAMTGEQRLEAIADVIQLAMVDAVLWRDAQRIGAMQTALHCT